MRKQILVIFISLFMVGCAYHGPLQSLPAVSSDDAATLVVITEDSFWTKGYGLIPTIDGIQTYAMDANQYIVLRVAPGNHTVIGNSSHYGAHITDESIVTVSPQAGETIYLYFVLLQNFPAGQRTVLKQITEEEALKLMEKATRVGPQ
jgi:hypothetical protein